MISTLTAADIKTIIVILVVTAVLFFCTSKPYEEP